MIPLYHDASGQQIGEISEADFALLQSSLEEESTTDDNYYIDEPTIDLLREQGASATLLDALTRCVAANGPCDVRWQTV